MTPEPSLLSVYAAQALYERLQAAAWPDSPVNVDENAALLTMQLLKLGRPTPCHGEPAPESRTYGPNGKIA